ncbi:hypothetical protein [Microbacterium sp.]|uniref:hypothetical protein n=1 Tax=Microbacterium sp. TaxID=51671 RepID=UPI00281135C4|nr:hypothetical protein [Microbacterium sp.]
MHVGVRITESVMAGVYVRSDGRRGMQQIRVADDAVPSAFDRLLSRLISEARKDAAAEADAAPGADGAAAGGGSEQISTLTVDVSALLTPKPEPVTVVRIAPRPPVDRAHELRDGEAALSRARILHVAGGHTTLGEELVPFDAEGLRRIVADVAPGGRYAVTSVGSLIDSSHEIEAGKILLEHAAPASVGYSHHFDSGSFGTRERTAVINSSLIPEAESLVTSLVLVASTRLPHARLYVTTNDGGCVPLARLSVTPVHSMAAARASELIGAAVVCGIDAGRLAVAGPDGAYLGEMIDGVAAVRAKLAGPEGAIATKAAHLVPLPAAASDRPRSHPVVAEPGHTAEIPDAHPAVVDLCALGAASSALTEWTHRVVIISNAEDIRQALVAAEARVRTRLVALGASPSHVRVIDSRVVATTYQEPRVVAVRVRAVASGAGADGGWRGGESHAPHG